MWLLWTSTFYFKPMLLTHTIQRGQWEWQELYHQLQIQVYIFILKGYLGTPYCFSNVIFRTELINIIFANSGQFTTVLFLCHHSLMDQSINESIQHYKKLQSSLNLKFKPKKTLQFIPTLWFLNWEKQGPCLKLRHLKILLQHSNRARPETSSPDNIFSAVLPRIITRHSSIMLGVVGGP